MMRIVQEYADKGTFDNLVLGKLCGELYIIFPVTYVPACSAAKTSLSQRLEA